MRSQNAPEIPPRSRAGHLPLTQAIGRALSTMPFMSFVEVTKPHPHVSLVTLNRPERMNAMAFDVMIPFRDALRELGSDNDTRVVVITGAGTGFCSGADLEDPGTIPDIDGLTLPTIALRSMELLDEVIATIRRLHQPVIAAVNGPAIGGGFCLSLSTDIRIAADTAYFRAAGINNGLTAAELGISYLLPRSIGQSRAAEIMFTGRDVSAAEAERIGLVSQVVTGDALLGTCFELADRIIGWSRAGIELTKRQLWNSLDASSLQTHMDAEGVAQLFVRITTKNFEESVRARREKRPPKFVD
jgi:enoyl-CoA hydratase